MKRSLSYRHRMGRLGHVLSVLALGTCLVALASSTSRALDLSRAQRDRLDPALRTYLAADEGVRKQLGLTMDLVKDRAAEYIGVLVLCEAPDATRGNWPDFAVGSTHGDVLVGLVPVEQLASMASDPNILYIEASRPLQPLLDVSVPEINADQVHASVPSYTGQGVIIGIVDGGIDLQHPDFQDESGNTRVLYLWDQWSGDPPAPSGFPYGTEYSAADIDNGLCPFLDTRWGGHGTHVSGIAASNGLASDMYTGVAPGASIIAVSDMTMDLHYFNSGSSRGVLDAFDYIRTKADALGMPAVINLSDGSATGPHDGNTVFEYAVNADVAAGISIVAAAGNSGDDGVHCYSQVLPGSSTTESFVVESSDPPQTEVRFQVWYEGGDLLQLEISGPSTGYADTIEPWSGEYEESTDDGLIVASEQHAYALNGDNMYEVTILEHEGTSIGTGTWHLRLSPAFGSALPDGGWFHAWFEHKQHARFTSDVTASMTICIPASADSVIAVGSYNTRGDAPGDSSDFTSRGPRRDGVLKPDICAPGYYIISSRSWATPESGNDPDFYHTRMEGTSMAAPHVAGTIALLLEETPSLTPSQLRHRLVSSAREDTYTGSVPNYTWGHGKLDALGAMRAAELSGTISEDRTLLAGSVYRVTGTVTVNEGVVLTIEPNVILKFYGCSLVVRGTLDIQAGEGSEVIFTSYMDDSEGGDTNGDGLSVGSAGEWVGVLIEDSCSSDIHHSVFKFGGGTGWDPVPTLHIDGTAPAQSVTNCTFMDNKEAMRYDAETAFYSSPLIADNVFLDSPTGVAIKVVGSEANTSAHIQDNMLYGCSIQCWDIAPTSSISGNAITAGQISLTRCSPLVLGNTIQDFDGYPIRIRETSFPNYGGNTIQNNTYHALDVGGTITADGTWDPVETGDDLLVYMITSGVTVSSGATLTIPAGTVVKFTSAKQLIVNGNLVALGSPGNEIVFTSYGDDDEGGDTNGDRGATTPSPGDWRCVKVAGGASVIEHCRFKYGGYNGPCLWVYRPEPAVAIRNCDFRYTHWSVIRYELHTSTATNPAIEFNTFEDCIEGVHVVGGAVGSSVSVIDNTFIGTSLVCDNCSPLVSGNAFQYCQSYPLEQLNNSFPTYDGNTFQWNTYHAIGVTGFITEDGSWPQVLGDSLALVYQLSHDLVVEEGATLTLPPSTIVKFAAAKAMFVRGILDAQGSEGQEIVFTSWRDDDEGGDTNGDGFTTGAAGDWKYIKVEGGGSSLEHIVIKYAGSSGSIGLWIDETDPSIPVRNCAVLDCHVIAIRYDVHASPATSPIISDNYVANSTRGIQVYGNNSSAAVIVDGNTLQNCTIECHDLGSGSVVTDNAVTGGGLQFFDCSPHVSGNTIQDYSGYPITLSGTSFPTYSGNAFLNNGHRAIQVKGSVITLDGTWVHVPSGEFPLVYELTGGVIIAHGTTLTLPPGTVVKFAGDHSISVEGTLDAQASAGNEVVFTSWRDDSEWGDSNCDGLPTPPVKSDWGSIIVKNSGNSVDHWRVKYAGGAGNDCAIQVYHTVPALSITNCTIESCDGYSIRYEGDELAVTAPIISYNTITDAEHGIWVTGIRPGTSATISDNSLSCGYIGSYYGIRLENLDSESLVSWNSIENFNRAIYCTNTEATITCNSLAQTGGFFGIGTGVYAREASDLIINSNTIQGFSTGLQSESGSGNPPSDLTVSMNRILDSGDRGVYLRSTSVSSCTGPSIELFNNDIYGSTNYDLYLGQYQDPGTTVVNVESNWWGTIDTEAVSAKIYDHADDSASPTADFIPLRQIPISFADPDIWFEPSAVSFKVFPGSGSAEACTLGNAGVLATLFFSIEEATGANREDGTALRSVAHLSEARKEGPQRADVQWLAVSPMSGSALPEHETQVQVTCSSTGMDEGDYDAYLVITSNDPDESPTVVPVRMSVSAVFLTSPDGGEELPAEELHPITWVTDDPDSIAFVDLYLSTDAGATYEEIATVLPDTFSYDWLVPDTNADFCLVKAIAHYIGGGQSEDTSDRCFAIRSWSSVPDEEHEWSGTLVSLSASPNPFSEGTSVRFVLATEAVVSVSVYDVRGRLVATPLAAAVPAGEHFVPWEGHGDDGRVCASGVYFCRVEASGERLERKIVLLR